MKNLLTLLAVLLVAICLVVDQSMAKDRPFGYPDDGDSHPWGGDEATIDPGDGLYGGPRAAALATTGILPLDILINEFIVKPLIRESSRTSRMVDEPIRKADYITRTPYYNRTELQR
ncbi:MAG: hypothetical protein RBT76_13340 [candidate division Zixibacteria bacterium]|jgi:hypothetical protein|nr:hypothetical protein [candidate division Zixibacteria bacterium]